MVFTPSQASQWNDYLSHPKPSSASLSYWNPEMVFCLKQECSLVMAHWHHQHRNPGCKSSQCLQLNYHLVVGDFHGLCCCSLRENLQENSHKTIAWEKANQPRNPMDLPLYPHVQSNGLCDWECQIPDDKKHCLKGMSIAIGHLMLQSNKILSESPLVRGCKNKYIICKSYTYFK